MKVDVKKGSFGGRRVLDMTTWRVMKMKMKKGCFVGQEYYIE
jgi:hypothetical protein